MALSIEELEEGRRIAALVVKHCGDRYRPLFVRFDQEVQNMQNSDDRLNLVLNSQAPTQRVRHRRHQKQRG